MEAPAQDALWGWETALRAVGGAVRRKADLLLAFAHFNLSRRGFRCLGLGDERTLSGEETATELLPDGWSEEDQYKLRYLLDNKLYILHGLVTDGILILNLMRAEDLAVSNISINVDDTVKDIAGPIEKIMPDYKDVLHNLKRDLIDTMCAKKLTSTETQTAAPAATSRSLDDPFRLPSRLEDPLRIPNSPLMVGPDRGFTDPLQIGRSDLDPFAPGGGGMIFNPFGPNRSGPENPGLGIPGGLPRSAIPPGARFDPFAPPSFPPPPGRRQPPPDSDHLPPPGYNDMFM